MIQWTGAYILTLGRVTNDYFQHNIAHQKLMRVVFYIQRAWHSQLMRRWFTSCVMTSCVFDSYIYLTINERLNGHEFVKWLATGRWISPCTTVSSTNKSDRHDIAEKLLKVELNTINITPFFCRWRYVYF
jgi:hypothetical protein